MIDLHLHLDGSLDRETLFELAKINNVDPKIVENVRLSADSSCHNLVDYIKLFDFPLTLLQEKEAISYAVESLCKRLSKQGLIYVEIRFAPCLSLEHGLSQEDVVLAAIKGLEKGRKYLKANLILCLMRGRDLEKKNTETVRLAHKYLNKGVVALDLAGAEALWNNSLFVNEFAEARSLNIPLTIHAGEADGGPSVWEAIVYGAKRIGHGVRCIEDPELVEYLIVSKIPLEICPSSEVDTQCFEQYKDIPIKYLYEKGVKVTINTDDMTVSDVTLNKEIKRLHSTFKFGKEIFKEFFLNSIDVAFCSKEEKEELRAELENKFPSYIDSILGQ